MTSVRTVRPTDLVALAAYDGRVYPNESVTRDRIGTATSPHPLETALEQWFSFATGRHTWISVKGATLRGLVSARRRGSKAAWEVDCLIDAAEEDGLVHEMPNSTRMTTNVMCSCCRDCCVIWVPMDEHGVHISKRWAKSRFEARVDWDLCHGCQDCVERCQFDAIEMVKPEGSKKYKAIVDPERCWGCGVCVLACAPEALSVAIVRPPEHIPEAAPAT